MAHMASLIHPAGVAGGMAKPGMGGGVEVKALGKPDDIREFDNGKMLVYKVGGGAIGRAELRPGWKWSTCVKPIAKTDTCMHEHHGAMISGRMMVKMADGTETELKAGDAVYIPAGHDAWVVGDETCVMVDFTSASQYAARGAQPAHGAHK